MVGEARRVIPVIKFPCRVEPARSRHQRKAEFQPSPGSHPGLPGRGCVTKLGHPLAGTEIQRQPVREIAFRVQHRHILYRRVIDLLEPLENELFRSDERRLAHSRKKLDKKVR